MKPQIIDRYVYVKGKKISEATSKSNLDGNEILPLAYNDVNYNTTVDQISEYVDKVHDYLTTENYNDLKGQIDSERTNRQEADNELNQSIQDTKSELHSTISGVESELLGEVNDLQEQIDNINDTGIAKGVTLDTAQTITGEKTFTTVPKSTANATEDTDLVNKKYVDNIVKNAYIINYEDLQDDTVDESIINNIKDAYNNDQPIYIKDSSGGLLDVQYSIENSTITLVITTISATSQGSGRIEAVTIEINTNTRTVYTFAISTDIRNSGNGNKFLADDGDYHTLTKANVGLGNVDNTSDLNKPVSNATKEYINEQGFARVSDIPEGLEIGETTGTAFDGGRGKAVEDNIKILPKRIVLGSDYPGNVFTVTPTQTDVNIHGVSKVVGEEDSITHNASSFVIPSATPSKAGAMSAADKQKLDKVIDNGDGTKYLSDNGTYKTIEIPDLSNYLTEDDKTELETEIGDLSENVNGQITELQKKDSTIEGNVTNLTETVNTINDTVSGLDNIYLRKTGGTINGNVVVNKSLTGTGYGLFKIESNSSGQLLINYDSRNGAYFSVDSAGRLYIESKTDNVITGKGLIVSEDGIYRSIQGANVSDRWNNKSLIFDAGNISGSKVTTNDISGGLNITKITQSAYDGLDSKDANTLYIITE